MPRVKLERNIAKARNLRANMSLPEVLLWRELRRQSEIKFRRQHPIGPYILDFYCTQAKICVEIDGIAHEMGGRPQRDARRDEWLQEQGIEVVRIAASDVLASPEDMADALVRYCQR